MIQRVLAATATLALAVSCGPLRPIAHGPFQHASTASAPVLALRTREVELLRCDILSQRTGAPLLSIEETLPAEAHLFSLGETVGREPSLYRITRLTPAGPEVIAEGVPRGPPGDRSATVHAALVGDSGPIGFLRARPQLRVGDLLRARSPDLLIHLGDLVYSRNGKWRNEYEEAFFAPFAAVLSRCLLAPTPGNHDVGLDPPDAYDLALRVGEVPGARDYSFDWGPVHLACVDTSSLRGFTPSRVEWLERDLARSESPWKIVFTHQPPVDDDETGKPKDPPELSGLLAALQRARVPLLVAGHYHTYRRYRPLGPGGTVRLVVSGGGGATLTARPSLDPRVEREERTHHFLWLEATPTRLVIEAVSLDGQILDRLELKRRPAPGDGV